MKRRARGAVAFVLACLTTAAAAQQGRDVSGRVVDGLGRPVAGVRVTFSQYRKNGQITSETVLRTGDDGRYAGTLPTDDPSPLLGFAKDGYESFFTSPGPGGETTLRRKVDWDEAALLPDLEGDALDRGLREVLASEEMIGDGELLGFLFKHQEECRPALRRLLGDAHVGAVARDWLDLLGDPRDRDLFPKGRRYAPREGVKETDLIEALKATARRRHFFSTAPEPSISIDFIALTEDLDRALIQCGINRAALTGITWRFVFRKVGTQWELRSAREAGRS